jgi:D-aspartate ligase
MPVIVLDTSRRLPAMWAHGCMHAVITSHDRPLIGELLRVRTCFDEDPLLFLASEPAVFAISEARTDLTGYRLRLPPHEMVLKLSNKIGLQRLAEQCEFPVPKAVCLETESDIAGLTTLEFPVVIKPADKRLVYSGDTPRIHLTHELHEAQVLSANLLSCGGQFVAQSWVPGGDDGIYFCLFYCGRENTPVSIFTGRKVLSSPPRVGSTSICIAAPEVETCLEPMVRRFIDRVGFAGMGSIEFKWHPLRREFLMIEPTVGRTDWQEEIATLCGANIPLAAYHHELGMPHKEAHRRNVGWRESFGQSWPSTMPRGKAHLYDGYWRLADPMPAFAYYVGRALERFRRCFPPNTRAPVADASSSFGRHQPT